MDLNDVRIENAKKGDKKAQMELYNVYSNAMYNTGFRILKNRMEAEDAMHDAFLKAFTKLDDFIGQVSFGAWLKRIVVNTCLDKLKKHQPDLFDGDEELQIADTPDQDQEDLELEVDKVHRAIHALPAGYRSIVSLRLIEGYDHEEIAQIMGISSSTSRSQYARARKVLRSCLMQEQHV